MGLLDDAIREHLELKRRRGGDPAEIERAERDALGPVRREPEPLQPAGYDQGPEPEHELVGEEPYAELEPVEYDEPYPETPEDLLHEPYPEASEGLTHEPFPEPRTEFLPPPAPPVDEFPPPAAEPADEFLPPRAQPAEEFLPRAAEPVDEPLGDLPPEPEPPLAHGAVGAGPETPPPTEPPYGLRDDEDPWLSEPAPRSSSAMPHEERVEPEPFAAPRHDPLPEPAEPARDHLNQETAEYRLEHVHDEEEAEDVLEETPDFLQDAPEHDRLWFEQRPPRDFDFDN